MKYISRLFQPVITIPKNANIKNTEITCKSQKLLLELGLVRPTSSGLFTLLPLARRAIDKLEALVRHCIEEAGGQRVSLPALTAASLWEKSGRLQDIGPELVKVQDRHGHKYLLAPTHEEAVADLLADVGPLSYKQLPLLLYQISNKYRDEHRPKHGLLRAREFLMMDAYGAHQSETCAEQVYNTVTDGYQRLFEKLELPVYKVEAPSGDMGGSLSHEWQLCARAGEDTIQICPSCSHAALEGGRCKCGKEMETHSSIEVGHTFILGDKYSNPLRAHFAPSSGAPQSVIMSCYGIGITRLLAASLEALSTDTCLRWPKHIAPFSAIIIGPKEGSKEWSAHSDKIEEVYHQLNAVPSLHGDVLIDDRHHLTIGKRLMMADRLGSPLTVVLGKSLSSGHAEVYRPTPHGDAAPQLLTTKEMMDILYETVTNNNILDRLNC